MDQEIMARFREVIENLPHCRKIGLKVDYLDKGKGRFGLMPHDKMIGNPVKRFVHSGISTSLLDTLCGAVAMTAYPGFGQTVATLDLRLDHLRRLSVDARILAEAECYHFNDSVAYVRGRAWQDGSDEIALEATATFMPSGPIVGIMGEA